MECQKNRAYKPVNNIALNIHALCRSREKMTIAERKINKYCSKVTTILLLFTLHKSPGPFKSSSPSLEPLDKDLAKSLTSLNMEFFLVRATVCRLSTFFGFRVTLGLSDPFGNVTVCALISDDFLINTGLLVVEETIFFFDDV